MTSGEPRGIDRIPVAMADFEKPCDHDMVHTLMHDLAAARASAMAEAMKRW